MGAFQRRQTHYVRIATWNIRAGGGKRVAQIASVIIEEQPDLLVLTEYRAVPGVALLDLLVDQSYHRMAGVSTAAQNCVCVLSRFPLDAAPVEFSPKSFQRWVPVFVPELELTILAVHVPNQGEVWDKREFWECIEAFASATLGKRALIIGDLNTALDEDCEGQKIREAVYLNRLHEAGWVDAWRTHNPGSQQFSWYSQRSNGFRIDHCLVSPPLANSVVGAKMRHDVRTNRLSDHSMLTIEFEMGSAPVPRPHVAF